MTHVKLFSDTITVDVTHKVEEFLNNTNGIQILDISWIVKSRVTMCIITYFEV